MPAHKYHNSVQVVTRQLRELKLKANEEHLETSLVLCPTRID